MFKKAYLYLAKKDKKGIKILSEMEYNSNIFTTKLTNLDNFNITKNQKIAIDKIINENKMNYDLYIESSDNFQLFIESLHNRGYKNLPITNNSMFYISLINKKTSIKPKTMLRKKS